MESASPEAGADGKAAEAHFRFEIFEVETIEEIFLGLLINQPKKIIVDCFEVYLLLGVMIAREKTTRR